MHLFLSGSLGVKFFNQELFYLSFCFLGSGLHSDYAFGQLEFTVSVSLSVVCAGLTEKRQIPVCIIPFVPPE